VVGLPLVPVSDADVPPPVEDVVRPGLVLDDELVAEVRVGVVELVVVGAGVVVRGAVCWAWVGCAPPPVPVVATVTGSGRTTR
jgi:hypothetical protein